MVPGKIPRHILFLREPADRIVFQYNFKMGKDYYAKGLETISFKEWYDKNKRGQSAVDWLLRIFLQISMRQLTDDDQYRIASECLKHFWFVADTKNIDHYATPLLHRIGVPLDMERSNVTGADFPQFQELSNDLRERLNADFPLDVEFYRAMTARTKEYAANLNLRPDSKKPRLFFRPSPNPFASLRKKYH